MSLTKVGNKCGEDDDGHDQGHLETDLADPEEQAHVLGLLPWMASREIVDSSMYTTRFIRIAKAKTLNEWIFL